MLYLIARGGCRGLETLMGVHNTRRPMTRRTISLDSRAYDRLQAARRPGESLSETVHRLLDRRRPSFRALAGGLDPAAADAIRDAIRKLREADGPAERAGFDRWRGNRRRTPVLRETSTTTGS